MRGLVRVLSIGLLLLGPAACLQQKVEPKPKPEVVAGLELQVDAPGMAPEDVEQLVVRPIELALVGNSDIREIVSEARGGRARIRLGLSNRGELVAPDVLKRVTEIQSQLPEDVDLPVLRLRDPYASSLYFALADEHAEAAQTLLRALEATPGVRELSRCGPEPVVAIELDPAAMQRMNVSLVEVERATRAALLMQSAITVEELPKLALARADGSSIELAQLAAIRLETATDGCEAHAQQGPMVAFGITMAHTEARTNVEQQLDEARERGLVVRRFDSRLHVWLTPTAELEPVLERIPELAGTGWLLEVGAETEPCAGPGTLARLHLPAGATTETIVEGLAGAPGVAFIEHPENPGPRRWLLGPDLDELARLARAATASASSVALLDGEPIEETVVDIDRDKLATLGLARDDVMLAMAMALDNLEVGHIRDVGAVQLRFGTGANDPAQLAEVPLSTADGQTITLSTIADLRSEAGITRVCRRNGERGVVLLVRPQDAGSSFEVELPPGYRWGDEP